jgi:hypothetical protein
MVVQGTSQGFIATLNDMKKRLIPHLNLDPRHMHVGLSGAWITGVIVALVGTVVVALAAVVLFLGIFDADIAPTDASSDVESISRDDLSNSIRIIDARQSYFERLKVAPPTLPDPSR